MTPTPTLGPAATATTADDTALRRQAATGSSQLPTRHYHPASAAAVAGHPTTCTAPTSHPHITAASDHPTTGSATPASVPVPAAVGVPVDAAEMLTPRARAQARARGTVLDSRIAAALAGTPLSRLHRPFCSTLTHLCLFCHGWWWW